MNIKPLISKIHYLIWSKIGIISYTPFRKQSGSDEFFEAGKQVVAAVKHFTKGDNQSQGRIELIFYPLIVFEGYLYEMELTGTEPSVNTINHLLYVNFDLEAENSYQLML